MEVQTEGTVTVHPKAEIAKQKAIARKVLRDSLHEDVKEMVDRHKLRFISRPPVVTPWGQYVHGMSIAYSIDRRDVVRVATAICHPNDKFDKLTGNAQAALNFASGSTITLRRVGSEPVSSFLRETFLEPR